MIRWALEHYSKADLSKVLASTSLNFDLSVFELFVPLAAGTTVVLVDNIMALATMNHLEPSLINTVPSGIEALLDVNKVPSSAGVINLAGEPLPATIVDQLLAVNDTRRVYNLYGPSEATTYSTFCEFTQPVNRAPGIGRPLDNTQCYVLDAQQRLCPVGVAGQLYIAGQGVAKGYVNLAELSAQKFVQLPHIAKDTVLYQTGDVVSWRHNGQLDYIGRADEQVKLRGYRIELGDIEFHAEAFSGVKKCLVCVKKLGDEKGQSHLVAYLTQSQSENLSITELKQHLGSVLPDYMVPSYFELLAEFPYTSNGKIDKSALPLPVDTISQQVYVAPTTEVEQTLAKLWDDQLGLEHQSISTTANFFALGGHSLLAMKLMVRVNQRFEVNISERQLFENPTLVQLAQLVEQNQAAQLARQKFAQLTNTDKHDADQCSANELII